MREKSDKADALEKTHPADSEALASAEELYAEAIDKATKLVRKHPIEAIAVTFGVGCLMGILVSRR